MKNNIFSHIIILPQVFLIWWTGADHKKLAGHLRKPYAGLGAMALISTTLATFGGFSFILICLNSIPGAIFGGGLAGAFMWGMDRAVLGFPSPNQGNISSEEPQKLNQSFWVKLLVNIAFSSILTVPLSTIMLMGAVQEKNIEETNIKIKELKLEIKEKEADIEGFKKNLEYFTENPQLRTTVVNGKAEPNLQFINGHKAAQESFNQALEEKTDLHEERKELKKEIETYERGDLSKSSLKFPNLFNYIMNEARWTDNLLSFLFFMVTALMGSGAVLIKTFIFTGDSYSKKLELEEKKTKLGQFLAYDVDVSANQITMSLFNKDVMSEDLKTKLDKIKHNFDERIVNIYQLHYNCLADKIERQFEKEAQQQGISLDEHSLSTKNKFDLNDKNNRNSAPQSVSMSKNDSLFSNSQSKDSFKHQSDNNSNLSSDSYVVNNQQPNVEDTNHSQNQPNISVPDSNSSQPNSETNTNELIYFAKSENLEDEKQESKHQNNGKAKIAKEEDILSFLRSNRQE